MVRTIPDASPLRPDRERGYEAEDATHEAAAVWGLPDFIYHSEVRKVGSGTREIGDCVLIVGDLGVVVQVKTRGAATSDPEKERGWVKKKTADALRQANGTIRHLERGPAPLTNGRGRTIDVDGRGLRWIAAVVIDHPDVPADMSIEHPGSRCPFVVLARRDWEFLFDQLKSIHAVGEYLERVAGTPAELGQEAVRYYELALADDAAPPGELHPALVAGGERVSGPQLPLAPAGSDDEFAHSLIRAVYEDIATAPGPVPGLREADRLKVLAELDRLPVSMRASIGRFLIGAMREMADVPDDETGWRFRRPVGGRGKAHLGFGVCSQQFARREDDPMYYDLFAWWVQLRHHELQQITGEMDLTTVGVVLSPRRDGKRLWDTTMAAVSGDLGLSDEELSALRDVWRDSGNLQAEAASRAS